MKRFALLLLSATSLAACASADRAAFDTSRAYADFLIGRVANLTEDHVIASNRYYAALQTSHDAYLVEGGVRASLAIGDHARAREIARIADDGESGVASARLVRAADALAAGRWAQARSLSDNVDGDIGEEFAARLLQVWAKAGDRQIDDAISDLGQLSAPRPFSAVFTFQEALALDLAGRNDAALAAYERAEGEGLWLPPAVVRHADLLVRMNERTEAANLLRRYRDENGNPEMDAALTRVNAGAATVVRPLTAARAAAIGVYGLGALLSQETDADDGLVILSLATMLDPTLDAAQLAFAESHRDRNQNEAARMALARLPANSPYAETARMMSAWILRDNGEESAAIAAAREAAATGGRRAQIAYADLLRSYDRYSDAEPIYSQLIGAGSDDWRLYFARGASRERLGQWREAEDDLQHALQIEPDQADVLNYLGYSWVDRGERLREGLALITRAADVRPNSGAILDSLGWAHYRLGDYDQAVSYLERAVELEPSDPILNDHLGDCYWRIGRRIEARFQWRRVLTLKPDAALETEANRKIEAGLPQTPLAQNAR